MRTNFRHALAVVSLLASAAAFGIPNGSDPFQAASQTNVIAVTNSASTAIQPDPNATGCVQYQLQNTGSTDVWVGFGVGTGTAPTIPTAGSPSSAIMVKAGASTVVTKFANAYVSAITASGSSTLNVACGTGIASGVPGSNVGGAVTVSQGTTGTAGVVLLNAVSATGAGTAYNNGTSGYTAHDIQVTTTGSPTYSINFEASLDNTNWVILDSITSSSTTPNQIGSAGFYPYLRANLTSLSGGTLTALYSGAVSEAPQVSIVGQAAAKSGLQMQGVDTNGLAQNVSVDAAGAASSKAVAMQGIAGGVAVPVSQSGTWTMQPGNTPNTSAWLFNTPPGSASCKTVTVNSQGVSNADITVDATAGGVSVLAASATRCGATLVNVGAADMRCGPTSMTVTSTAGLLVQANGGKLSVGLEGQQAFKCIRTAATSTTASVIESAP